MAVDVPVIADADTGYGNALNARRTVQSYENAGHGFFAVDRPSYRPEAAADGWRRIWRFLERSLQAAAGENSPARGV